MSVRSLSDLYHAETWVFDLDNTLYPAECNLFAQIDKRMTEFVSQYLDIPPFEALGVQKHYYRTYGTTLSGMMKEHGMPASAFLDYVHDLDYTPVLPAPELKAGIEALPGNKIVFTNGSRGHAERTLKALGLDDGIFSELFGIEEAGFTPKPRPEAFDALLSTHQFDPTRAVMVEDLSRNLVAAHQKGFATVLVWSWTNWDGDDSDEPDRHPGKVAETEDHVHHTTDDLTGFLKAVAAAA